MPHTSLDTDINAWAGAGRYGTFIPVHTGLTHTCKGRDPTHHPCEDELLSDQSSHTAIKTEGQDGHVLSASKGSTKTVQ